MTPAELESIVLLQQSAADIVRLVEEALCRAVPADRRTGYQHNAIYMARKFYNALVADGDIKGAADLSVRAAAVAKVVGRRMFVAGPTRDNSADLEGGY